MKLSNEVTGKKIVKKKNQICSWQPKKNQITYLGITLNNACDLLYPSVLEDAQINVYICQVSVTPKPG